MMSMMKKLEVIEEFKTKCDNIKKMSYDENFIESVKEYFNYSNYFKNIFNRK